MADALKEFRNWQEMNGYIEKQPRVDHEPFVIPPGQERLYGLWLRLRAQKEGSARPRDCGLSDIEGRWAVNGVTDEPRWVYYWPPNANKRLTRKAFHGDVGDKEVLLWIDTEDHEPAGEPLSARWEDCVIAYELLSFFALKDLYEAIVEDVWVQAAVKEISA
jgi:hypothetical protein